MGGREALLRALGADESTLPELLAYVENPVAGKEPVALAGEEPHVAAWREYAADSERDGVVAALAPRFAQLLFPVAAGTSGREDYRAATRRGQFPAGPVDGGLRLVAAQGLRLSIHHSIGGPVPVLVAPERADFVALVQALTARNEPEPVPASMGACIVSGLNNWDRVARHRAAWSAGAPAATEEAWQEEFRRLAANKPLYQDRLLLLSTGPYSAVAASQIGLAEADWLERSLILRREHECTHLFTQRAFGAMRNHALDELLADFAGLVAAFDAYRPELARRFLGVETGGGYRTGGRLQNYRGQPPISEPAFAVLVRLVDAAIDGLERAAGDGRGELDAAALGELVGRLYRGTLADLAAPAAPSATAAVARERVDSLDEAAIDLLMTRLAEFARRAGVPMAVQLELRLVLDELLSNLHKYGRRDGRGPAVEVEARVEAGALALTIGDDGPPFDPLAAPQPRLDAALAQREIGGLGLHLVRQIMHQARYERDAGWNRLRLRRSWARR